jgi:DNA-binding response OmpR family regulator
MKPAILIVDDEPDALEIIGFNLENSGFDVIKAETGQEALQKVRRQKPDLVVLDLMLPELDGLDVCRRLRRDPATEAIPILMLTAKAEEIDRILGLEIGADDYVTKPFSPRELVLRIKKLLTRAPRKSDSADCFHVGVLTVDIPRHQITVQGRAIDLTATEFKLLQTLIQKRGRVQSRDQLLQQVWGYLPEVDTRTVDTHMRRLREKLGDAAAYLETIRNVGYRFTEE